MNPVAVPACGSRTRAAPPIDHPLRRIVMNADHAQTLTTPARRRFLQSAAATVVLGSLPLSVLAQSGGAKLKIGIVGSGRVGGAVGGAWVKAGHEVMFSSLDLEADQKLAASLGPNAKAGTPREAAAFGTVLLISVPYKALPG